MDVIGRMVPHGISNRSVHALNQQRQLDPLERLTGDCWCLPFNQLQFLLLSYFIFVVVLVH